MNKIWIGGTVLLLLMGLLGLTGIAQATVITSTLGNSTPGFNDGDTPAVFLVGAAQSGQPAPFDQSYGNDILPSDFFNVSWNHSYVPIVDTILSAIITFGIVDHDSSASGNQLDSFIFDGTDLTTDLNLLFEAAGEGADGQYDIYSLALPNIIFADLTDGLATVALSLQEPGLVTPLFPLPGPNPPIESISNGANLIFSSLEITTREATPVPEPSALALSLLGLGILFWQQYRRRV